MKFFSIQSVESVKKYQTTPGFVLAICHQIVPK